MNDSIGLLFEPALNIAVVVELVSKLRGHQNCS